MGLTVLFSMRSFPRKTPTSTLLMVQKDYQLKQSKGEDAIIIMPAVYPEEILYTVVLHIYIVLTFVNINAT